MGFNVTAPFSGALLFASLAAAQSGFSPGGANTYAQRQDWNGLVRYARSWTASEPGSAMAWYYLGSAYGIGLHEPASAEAPFEKAVQLNPRWAMAWNALGFTYLDLRRNSDAARAFQHAVNEAPQQSNYWNNLASAYSWAGRPDLATQTLERQRTAAARSATYVDWYNMGNGFANLGHRQEAIDAYTQALRMNQRFGPAWNNLGVAQQQLGDYSSALNSYRRAAAFGDSLVNTNAAALQSGMAAAQQRSGGRQMSPQMVREFIRSGQAHAWETNHPGQQGNPYGRP